MTADLAQTIQKERNALEESLRQTLAQREALRTHYETLLKERDTEAADLEQTLETKEREIEALRQNAKEQADMLRRKMEALRQDNRRRTLKQAPTSAAVWSAFETGVNYYQTQQWPQAAHAFEECLAKDPRWGAAYQYLALTYHAQGQTVKAAEIAARAKELDPENTQLSTWVDRLYASIREQKAS